MGSSFLKVIGVSDICAVSRKVCASGVFVLGSLTFMPALEIGPTAVQQLQTIQIRELRLDLRQNLESRMPGRGGHPINFFRERRGLLRGSLLTNMLARQEAEDLLL